MEKIVLMLSLFLFADFSCTKNEELIQAEIVRDCTGTYMHMNDLDYKVCNFDKVSSFETGAKVRINFKKLEDCRHPDDVMYCMMLHANAGWIQVTKIRN